MTARYALYFAPDRESDLARFGETVLGRSAVHSRKPDASSSFSNRSRWLALTRSPAHYGFHATLKAPFELQPDTSEERLIEAVSEYATQRSAISLAGLAPRKLSGFAALILDKQPDELTERAQSIVESFEPFRQALSDADLERRLLQSLTPRQLTLLKQFGYPYVADEFRFHMTLSGPLQNSDDDYLGWLSEQYQLLVTEEPILNQLAVYTQTDRESPFVQLACFSFAPEV